MVVQLSGTWQAAQSILKPSPWGDCACDADIRQPQSTKAIDNRTYRAITSADHAASPPTSEVGQLDRSNKVLYAGKAEYIGLVYVGGGRTVHDGWQFRMKAGETPTKRAGRSLINRRGPVSHMCRSIA